MGYGLWSMSLYGIYFPYLGLMNILLIGSGGREHAIAYKLTQSPLCEKLFVLPGNAGTASIATNIPLDPSDFTMTGKFCLDNDIGLVIVGPEEYLVNGLRDHFEADGQLKKIPFVGPAKNGAIIEGSKDWSKAFMKKYDIPTAGYETFQFNTIHEGIRYVNQHSLPVVLKADGLAAGKGVLICNSHDEAEAGLNDMLRENKFGNAGSRVVVEEYLDGIELSVFVLCDGKSYCILPSAKDYKRIREGDKGLNTGGMGAVSPVPFADAAFMKKVEDRIIRPSVEGLKTEGIRYIGFLFIGLMKVMDDPFVIEYNCRLGDPETEVVLPRIKNDLAELMLACASGELSKQIILEDERAAAAVMLVSRGYPEDYQKGKTITGFDKVENSLLFHAGTKMNEKGEVLTNGGRVIAITSFGKNIQEAVTTSLINADKIEYEGKYFRRDIGYEFKS